MDKVKVAVLGCGFFGALHGSVYKDLHNAALVGVCDLNEASANKTAIDCRTRAYTDLNQMLEAEKPDILDICLPDSLHMQGINAALAHNINFLVEKPLADRLEDCALILEKTKDFTKKSMVGFVCRFEPRFIHAYELLRSGRIGDIVYMTSKRVSPMEGGRHYAPLCKLTTHSGVHDIDLARWLTGSQYESVFAKGRYGRLKAEGYDAHDAVLSTFTFENGVIYSHENTWALPDAYPAYIEAQFHIVGTKGSIHIDMSDHGIQVFDDKKGEYPDLYHWPLLLGARSGALKDELAHFTDCVINDTTPRTSLLDGFCVTSAAMGVLESIDEGKEIRIQRAR